MIVSTGNQHNECMCLINTELKPKAKRQRNRNRNPKAKDERDVLLTQFDALLLLNTSLLAERDREQERARQLGQATA